MKDRLDFAGLLLKKARNDANLLRKSSNDPEIADDILGFHFQQTIEKSLKALLIVKNIQFRKTHDIRELLDLIVDNGIIVPQWFDELDAWTSFAVEYRYEDLPDGPVIPIPRQDLSTTAFAIIEFVERQLA